MEEVEKKGVRPDGYKATDEEVAQQEEMIERKGLNDVAVAENATTTSTCKDSIHRAMVLIAGIEMENPEDPPRLWTALEDAWDALCDALGTVGDVNADVAEAKAIGRHFVIKPSGNAAKMRSVLEQIDRIVWDKCRHTKEETEAHRLATEALTEPPRNCDIGTAEEQVKRWEEFCISKHAKWKIGSPIVTSCDCPCYSNNECNWFIWSQMPYAKESEVK